MWKVSLERYYFVLYDGAITLKISKMAFNSFCDWKNLFIYHFDKFTNYSLIRSLLFKTQHENTQQKCIVIWQIKGGVFPYNNVKWVSNFRNPTVTVKCWVNLDNPFKRTNFAKICMSPSPDGTMPESVISQENNSPLALYIEPPNFCFVLDINSPVDQVQS